ncbi:MAG TPA: preprotein translocase subunit YajC, partial [Thermomonas sp.]|nr:preprotein translocase subunit YajC [Thermomonas sp.]
MNPLDFLIPVAHAQAAAPAAAPGGMLSTLLFPVILIAIMYFLMIRPQMKRQKE